MWKFEAVNKFAPMIRMVEIERETAASVYIRGERCHKATENFQFCDTWEQAQAWLLEKARTQVILARRDLEIANARYGNVKGKRRPTEVGPSRAQTLTVGCVD